MSPSMPSPVIIYRYDASPYSVKIDNILILKNITHQKVNVSPVLPRPEITDLLGITYRRIPILAIGNDVYCDTSLIASALERRFPSSAGYGTIFPRSKDSGATDTGAIKIFAKLYESTIFPTASGLLPWEALPKAFLDDRSSYIGGPIDVKAMTALQGKSLTTLSSHLALLEEQLNDGREWLFNSELPSLADITVHFIFTWVKKIGVRPAKSLVDTSNFPRTLSWLTRISDYLQSRQTGQAAVQSITGDHAAKTIVSAAHEPYNVVGFNNQEAGYLGLKLNDYVQIAPDDTGKKFSTVGKLVGFNKEETVIEVQGSEGLLRCHFPRLVYTVTNIRPHKL
ncbi:hypothetical protein E4T56_gene10326 [Termitomyces sp. T112]|nr:hypothetical protein E4T56_gene10326 [Termitomyces sp. T112]